jgi:anti-anti-sigma regulatory factor
VGTPGRPPLALRFWVDSGSAPSLEIRGEWPDRAEWRALRSRQLEAGGRCHLSSGFSSGWLSGLFETDLLALEQGCGADGGAACGFLAREPAAWRATGDPRVEALLARLPFSAFRELVREHLGEEPGAKPREAFDPEAPVIHIWGPLMVIPFSNAEEAYRAVELIARDPAARHVSVVVVDLSGALLDEAFGAMALEQIVEAVEGLGAEVLFSGVSPLAERIVAELSRKPLLVHKDLHAAIASGFQIAESQRSGV